MPKYRLLSSHYIEGVVHPKNTVVSDSPGKGEVHFAGKPSAMMEGLDAEGKALVEKRRLSYIDPIKSLPLKMNSSAEEPVIPKKSVSSKEGVSIAGGA